MGDILDENYKPSDREVQLLKKWGHRTDDKRDGEIISCSVVKREKSGADVDMMWFTCVVKHSSFTRDNFAKWCKEYDYSAATDEDLDNADRKEGINRVTLQRVFQ